MAGGGEKVTLKIAATYASYTNFAGSLEEIDHKSDVLRGHCDAIGRDFGTITRSSNFNTIVGSTEAEARDRLAQVKARLVPHLGQARADHIEQDYLTSPAFGSTEQVAERLAERERHGIGYAIHYFPEAAYDLSGVELFEREVIGALGAEAPAPPWRPGVGPPGLRAIHAFEQRVARSGLTRRRRARRR